jgi:hypothetical protein
MYGRDERLDVGGALVLILAPIIPSVLGTETEEDTMPLTIIIMIYKIYFRRYSFLKLN